MKQKKVLLDKEDEEIPLDDLRLDTGNVRFIHLNKKLSEEEMEKEIWKDRDTKSLYEQIKSAKGLYEKPLVNSKNIVIEGNRRITCLRKLKQEANDGLLEGIEKGKFDKILCERVKSSNTKEQIDLYLASIHVKGKKEWPTFNRAKMIHDLREVYDKTYEFIAKHIGMGKITVIRMDNVYEQTLRYGDKHKSDPYWYRKFTYFDELYKKRDLKEFRTLQKNVDKFGDWVFEERFDDVRFVRDLFPILEDPDAFKVFEAKGHKEAFNVVLKKNPAAQSKEFRKIEETIKLIHNFPRNELFRTAKDTNRRRMLEQLKKEIDQLIKELNNFEKGSRDDHK